MSYIADKSGTVQAYFDGVPCLGETVQADRRSQLTWIADETRDPNAPSVTLTVVKKHHFADALAGVDDVAIRAKATDGTTYQFTVPDDTRQV